MSWIDDFVTHTSPINSPLIFRKWAGVGAISMAAERKVWTQSFGKSLYPNLYIIFVGAPGVGKTEASAEVQSLLTVLEGHHFSPSSVTSASIIDALREATSKFNLPSKKASFTTYHCLNIISNELGVLLPAYDESFMSKLQDLYDGKTYSERRRSSNLNFEIENPILGIMAACTPGYLMASIPEGAWDQGFLARCLMVFSSESDPRDPFEEFAIDPKLEASLKRRIIAIGKRSGHLPYSPAAKTMISNWYKQGWPPVPTHPKLRHYLARRGANMLKLSAIMCLADEGEYEIQASHVELALDYLLEAEVFMPDIFKSMKLGGETRSIDEAWHFIYNIYMKEGKRPVAEHRVYEFLRERVPLHNIVRAVETMERSKLITAKLTPGGKAFIPSDRRPS